MVATSSVGSGTLADAEAAGWAIAASSVEVGLAAVAVPTAATMTTGPTMNPGVGLAAVAEATGCTITARRVAPCALAVAAATGCTTAALIVTFGVIVLGNSDVPGNSVSEGESSVPPTLAPPRAVRAGSWAVSDAAGLDAAAAATGAAIVTGTITLAAPTRNGGICGPGVRGTPTGGIGRPL